jgi:hypothetical protein
MLRNCRKWRIIAKPPGWDNASEGQESACPSGRELLQTMEHRGLGKIRVKIRCARPSEMYDGKVGTVFRSEKHVVAIEALCDRHNVPVDQRMPVAHLPCQLFLERSPFGNRYPAGWPSESLRYARPSAHIWPQSSNWRHRRKPCRTCNSLLEHNILRLGIEVKDSKVLQGTQKLPHLRQTLFKEIRHLLVPFGQYLRREVRPLVN